MRASWFRLLPSCVLAFLMPGLSHAAAPDAANARFPIAEKDKGWGFIDRSGKVVIAPQFMEVRNFHDGLAAVLRKGKWGYIDTAGKMVVAPQFVAAEPFAEGLAAVRVSDEDSLIKDPYGYIDPTGKLVIPAKYGFAAPFSSGLARVNLQNKLIFINKTGEPLAFPEGMKKAYGDFLEKLAPVGDNRTSATGYIDPTGKLVIPPQAGFGAPFAEGLAAALTSAGKFPNVTHKLTFIDPTGKTVVNTDFSPADAADDPPHFSDGLCRVVHYDRKSSPDFRYLYLDKTGAAAIELTLPKLNAIYDFHEGLARVKIGGSPTSNLGGKFGYIDKTGKLVIPALYENAADFQDGLAQVQTDDGAAYIDKSGKIIYPAPEKPVP